SGWLASGRLRAVGDRGKVFSFERREAFAAIARESVRRYFGEVPAAWELPVGDLSERLAGPDAPADIDRVVLPMLAPWECIGPVAEALIPGGLFCAYVATTTQVSRVVA